MSCEDRLKDYRIPFGIGMLLFLLAGVWDSPAEWVRYLLVIVMLVGGGLMGWGIHVRNREEGIEDERFLMNRLKASRIALIAGLMLILGLMVYDWTLHHLLRWELFAVIGGIAVAKGVAMLYYQRVG
jgi:hypothetical protein